ncbi:MAG TPA: peptidylprolyl isomerase [Deltaproteobacteria bacterium]|jgi:FKBP-type peptidyl-prolyl cis-trans isomerase 2|nr:MAG: FKBP-type 16 kDa peptidyl-prolyl cis-trans isomerase [Deltaproteobacteria bacterium ADurb.Bin072]HNQ86561.1 peptidylprolyl isomerase [Deltaproteobacteria bacterium]HRW80393.1 peptidylprolyl isomerase [Desulfomonilia bacterium]HNS90658.1 peptidylprolyl isomerase [Deltaproteobacteria bacterium]HOA45505.1 peptidylprolyl isomerase [Deltaproteobacteria bacterium]
MLINKTAQEGDRVKVHYRGRLEDGFEFDTSVGGEPLVFVIGSGEVIPGFEGGARGMSVGELKTVTVEPGEGYGQHRQELVVEMPLESFPEDIVPEVGMQLKLVDENGEEVPVLVVNVDEETVTLDANHPLAGMTLTFEIELLEII